MTDQRANTYITLGIVGGVGVFVTFATALLGSRSGEIATALATMIGGSFVGAAAVSAWWSVQKQIASHETLERSRHKLEIDIVEIGFKSELLVYSHAVIQSLSDWNERAIFNPSQRVMKAFPKFPDPLYYRTNISKIGSVREAWAVSAIIGFYTNLLEINEQNKDYYSGNLSANVTCSSIAARVRIMAANMSQALDGLHEDKQFPVPQDLVFEELVMPNGAMLSMCEDMPTSLQDVLLRMAGCRKTRPGERPTHHF